MILAVLACLDDFPDRHADFDADGIAADEDCDDADAKIGVASLWYIDADGDGQGGDETIVTCQPPSNAVLSDGDCDDTDGANFVGNEEVCDDGDNDCNGQVDDITEFSPGAHFGYHDADGDQYGAPASKEALSCDDDRASNNDDCDDNDGAVNPGEDEVCGDLVDTDCDGSCDDCCFGDGEKSDNNVRDAAITLVSRNEGLPVGPALVTGDLFGESGVAFAAGSSLDGTVYAVPGILTVTSEPTEIDVATEKGLATIAVVRGRSKGDSFGASMATLESDLGVELLVGAPTAQESIGYFVSEGAVYVVPGPLSPGSDYTVQSSDLAFYMDAATPDTAFGSSILTGFDFDDDGTSEVVVSGVGESSEKVPAYLPGAVWVFYEPSFVPTSSSVMISGSEASDAFGSSLAAGDLDGDGIDDLVVGRTASTVPEVCVFLGIKDVRFFPIDSDDSDFAFVSFSQAANLGSSIALGDFDGDETLDVAAGANQPGVNGAPNATVRVFLNEGEFGSPKEPHDISLDANNMTFVGTDTDRTGTALVGRDFDLDAIDDLLIGSPGVAGGGRTYLIRMPQTGGVGPDDISAQWSSSLPGASLGDQLAADSFGGDDWPDVLLAAPDARSVFLWRSAGIW